MSHYAAWMFKKPVLNFDHTFKNDPILTDKEWEQFVEHLPRPLHECYSITKENQNVIAIPEGEVMEDLKV